MFIQCSKILSIYRKVWHLFTNMDHFYIFECILQDLLPCGNVQDNILKDIFWDPSFHHCNEHILHIFHYTIYQDLDQSCMPQFSYHICYYTFSHQCHKLGCKTYNYIFHHSLGRADIPAQFLKKNKSLENFFKKLTLHSSFNC